MDWQKSFATAAVCYGIRRRRKIERKKNVSSRMVSGSAECETCATIVCPMANPVFNNEVQKARNHTKVRLERSVETGSLVISPRLD